MRQHLRGTEVITFHKTQLARLMKGKNIMPGLQSISLHRFLQRFSMRQTTQRDYHNPTDTYYDTQFSAVETRLGCIPANVVSYSTFSNQTPSAIRVYRLPGR